MHTNLSRFLAIAVATVGLTAGAGAGVAAADPPSWSNAGGIPVPDNAARDEHQPAGAGVGRKVG
jgi:hypothetical protein